MQLEDSYCFSHESNWGWLLNWACFHRQNFEQDSGGHQEGTSGTFLSRKVGRQAQAGLGAFFRNQEAALTHSHWQVWAVSANMSCVENVWWHAGVIWIFSWKLSAGTWIMKSEDACVFCNLVSLDIGISLHLLGLPLADLAFDSFPEAWGILSLGAVWWQHV